LQEIDGRTGNEEQVLFAHHRQQRAGQAEPDHAGDGPAVPYPQPGPEEQRHGKCRTRMCKPRRDVHVEQQRGTQPDDHGRGETALPEDAPGDGRREQHRHQAIQRRTVRDPGHIGGAETVGDVSGEARHQVAGGVEGQPEDGGTDRCEIRAPARFVGGFEERVDKSLVLAGPGIVEIAVLVVEVDVAIERPGMQPREELDFVGGVDARRDGRQRDQEAEDEQRRPARNR
jgi:hypothetical protein